MGFYMLGHTLKGYVIYTCIHVKCDRRCYCNAAVVGLLALVQPTTSVFSDKLRRVLFTYSGVSTTIRLVAGI